MIRVMWDVRTSHNTDNTYIFYSILFYILIERFYVVLHRILYIYVAGQLEDTTGFFFTIFFPVDQVALLMAIGDY